MMGQDDVNERYYMLKSSEQLLPWSTAFFTLDSFKFQKPKTEEHCHNLVSAQLESGVYGVGGDY